MTLTSEQCENLLKYGDQICMSCMVERFSCYVMVSPVAVRLCVRCNADPSLNFALIYDYMRAGVFGQDRKDALVGGKK